MSVEEQSNGSTCFVRVLCHPGYGDATDFRVTEAQQEGSVGFGHQHVLSLLFIHKAKNCSGKYKHTSTREHKRTQKRAFAHREAVIVCVQFYHDLYTKEYKLWATGG